MTKRLRDVVSIGSLAAAVLFALVSLTSGTATAQEARSCGARADIIKQLATEYHEVPTAIGLGDNGALLEILASADGSTWTLLFSMPSGVSCLIASGQHLQVAPSIALVGRPA